MTANISLVTIHELLEIVIRARPINKLTWASIVLLLGRTSSHAYLG